MLQTVGVLAHFARERIPERYSSIKPRHARRRVGRAHDSVPRRSVDAKAAGAFGEFEVLKDVSDLTDASFLATVGKKRQRS